MELFHASHQWATRPADQRFSSFDELYAVTAAYAAQAGESKTPWQDLRVEAVGDDLQLIGKAAVPARITHYAFGQLSQRASAPAGYLRELPVALAAQNLNYGLKHRGGDDQAQLLFHTNGGLLLRAATGEGYARIWNYEVAQRLQEAAEKHDLVPARQTFTWGGEALAPESERPAALYASDHDLWAFAMSRDRVLQDPTGAALHRGIIVSNSEVGAASLKIQGFFFRDLCANHIIWGAKDLAEIRLTHVGNIRGRWLEATVEMRKYLDSPAGFDEAALQAISRVKIGGTKDDVLDAVFGKYASLKLSRKLIGAGYDAAVPEQDGDPNTVWGLAQGLTRHSQTIPYADERQQVDRAAGKLLEVTF